MQEITTEVNVKKCDCHVLIILATWISMLHIAHIHIHIQLIYKLYKQIKIPELLGSRNNEKAILIKFSRILIRAYIQI